MKDYWDRDANGSFAANLYINAHTLPTVLPSGPAVALMLFHAKNPDQIAKIEAEGLDAAERLSIIIPADRARTVAELILKGLEQAEEQLKNAN